MFYQPEPQIPHQNSGNAHNSTTVWTQPNTPEQRTYFSKHAPKRRAYGVIMTILQVAHGLLAFAAWSTIFGWAFTKFPAMQPMIGLLAITTLATLHWLFRVNWSTFWYDRLDDDPNTDSSPYIPLAILSLLLFVEVQGAQMFLTQRIEPAKTATTTPVDDEHRSTVTALETSYRNDVTEIERVYKEKAKATARPFDARIRSAQARRTDTPEAQRAVASEVRAIQRDREAAQATIATEKATAIEAALNRYNARKTAEESRRDRTVAQIDDGNIREITRYQSEQDSVASYAWILSVVLLSLIAGLGYAYVRINVKSGILPLRNYTVLDAHGGVWERFTTAIGDSFNRQSMRAAVGLHAALSPKDVIRSFDGTIISTKGTYNTPAGFHPDQPPVHTPTPSESEAYGKVITKLMQQQHADGIRITPDILKAELEKAKTMNGQYLKDPINFQ